MGKQPPPKFERGDYVRKRGSDVKGRVVERTPSGWLRIAWQEGGYARGRPLLCADGELERTEP